MTKRRPRRPLPFHGELDDIDHTTVRTFPAPSVRYGRRRKVETQPVESPSHSTKVTRKGKGS